MYNRRVIELEKELIETVGSSELHIATVKLILEKVLRMINDALNEDLNKPQESTIDVDNTIE